MHINRLRLLGFKSFVEPTELAVEKGLTGVVGPNGCGKSNLLEALRWVMGETSHKSMRAAAMDDVIFSGTAQRPARNTAEVTIFIDNSTRQAPAEFNGDDMVEVTRRIERDAGSAYRINGREVRARDVRILFEDAATGARSPALVRQGQIGELVNAKPEQRRRVLEDAAGIAGLHSRRHEAELRLKAAEGNLARLSDILGQLKSQIESLRRQARQARRYKELSAEIRKLEAILLHLRWTEAQAQVDAEEAGLAEALEKVGRATEAESKALRAEAEAAAGLQPLRDQEAAKGAILSRFRIEQENLEREVERTAERERELERARRAAQPRPRARRSLIGEAKETLERLEAEKISLANTTRLAADFEQKALAAFEEAEGALKGAEARLSQLTTATAEARARRQSLEGQKRERQGQVAKLERQLIALEAQTREIVGRAPDASKLRAAAELGQQLMAEIADIEAKTLAAEEAVQAAAADARAKSDAAAEAGLSAGQLKTEVETLAKLLIPAGDSGLPPILDQVKVEAGYEMALAAALGDDLDAPASHEAPAHWRLNAAERSRPRPAGRRRAARRARVRAGRADAPARPDRHRRAGRAARACSAALKPGQRLVSCEGDLWRWDGFVAAAEGVDGRRRPAGGAQPARRAGAAGGRAARRRRGRPRRAETAGMLASRRPGRGAPPAPALARGPGEAGADARRADRHGAAGARDGSTHRRRLRRQGAPGRGPRRGACTARRDGSSLAGAGGHARRSRPSLPPRRPRRRACARASARPHRAHHARARAPRAQRARGGDRGGAERWKTRSAGADQQIATLKERLPRPRARLPSSPSCRP